MWFGEILINIQATTSPDHVWPEVWTKIGKSAPQTERQGRVEEKPKLDNARRLRGIYFIDPEDKENKETIKKARRKLDVPMDAAMHRKKKAKPTSSLRETAAGLEASNKVAKMRYVCIVASHESTKQRVEPSLPQFHEDHIAGKGVNSMGHYILVHKFVPMPQVAKIPDAKAAVKKAWNKLETVSAWQLNECQEQQGGHPRGTQRQKESPLCYTDVHMSSQEFGVGTKLSEVQRSCRAPRRHCKKRLWNLCSFHWKGLTCISNDCSKSNGCHRQTTRLWWTSSWRSIIIHAGKKRKVLQDCSEF